MGSVPLSVLYIAAECKPFSKAGGVGDVAGELPVALREQGVEVEIVTPRYGGEPPRGGFEYTVAFHGVSERVCIERADLKGVPVHLVHNATYFATDYARYPERAPFADPDLFKRDYSKPYVDSPRIPFYDDALRFSFFSEACRELIARRKPDIVHINDWVLGYLFGRMAMKRMRQRRVLTIHNIGYQGNIGRANVRHWDIGKIARSRSFGRLFADPRAHWKSVNALRLAMELADQTNTVSPHYRDEITQPEDQSRYFEGGKGLHEIAARLEARGRLHGILNGFQYTFQPSDEAFAATLRQKKEMKVALSGAFADPDATLLGFVGRAVEQKFKLLTESFDGKSVLEHILSIPRVNVAVLASGLPEYEAFLRRFSGRANFSTTVSFDPNQARRISLGSDVFLMPSLFEPCGITQMESLSCATPPLVRWTGGLVDTVRAHTTPEGTGFGFDGTSAAEVLRNLVATVEAAVHMHRHQPEAFRAMQRRAFNARFLWSDSARRYIEDLYQPAMTAPRTSRSIGKRPSRA